MPLALPVWLNPFHRQPCPRLVLFGSDACGKTKLLYRWKTNGAVVTIPTIGFNVEDITLADPPVHREVHPSTASIPRRRRTLTVWDLGGCVAMWRLMVHYLTAQTSVLFLHDVTSSPERTEFSLELFRNHAVQVREAGAKRMWVVFTQVDLLKEEERAEKLKGLKRAFEREFKEFDDLDLKVVSCLGCSAVTGEGVWDVFEEVLSGIYYNSGGELSDPFRGAVVPEGPRPEDLIEKIKAEGASEGPPEKFWSAFISGELDTWDHRAHVRAGYLILLQSAQQMKSVHKTCDDFLAHLQRLREKNPDRFRNTAHRTMTTFWLHIIHVATLEYKTKNNMPEMPTPEQLQHILLFQPSLMDTGYWKQYYSKDLMMSPEARESWVLPDLQRLPSITSVQGPPRGTTHKNGDAVQDHLIEFAFYLMKYHLLRPDTRRGKLIADALPHLQTAILQARTDQTANIPPYSITQFYFWLQIVHAALASAVQTGPRVSNQEKEKNVGTQPVVALADIDYPTFRTLFDEQLNGSLWREYYDASRWDSMEARIEFLSPRKKPLPDVLHVKGNHLQDAIAFKAMVQVSLHDGADADSIAETLIAPQKGIVAHDLAQKAFSSFRAKLLLQEVQRDADEQSHGPPTHAQMIKFIFDSLIRSGDEDNLMALSTAANDAVRALHDDRGVSMTKASFWARLVTRAVVRRQHTNEDPEKKTEEGEWVDVKMKKVDLRDEFEKVVIENPELAVEELHAEYYSTGVWESRDAEEMMLPTDLKALPPGIAVA